MLGERAMVLRYFGESEHLILIVNLGPDLDFTPAPEPLLAPPGPDEWSLIWSSESVVYGGQGTRPLVGGGPMDGFQVRRHWCSPAGLLRTMSHD